MYATDFDYYLPEELIAQYPAERRDQSRLLVVDREKRSYFEKRFRDVAGFLRPGDCLVLNDTRVIPARLIARKADGEAKIEVFINRDLGKGEFEVLLRPAKRLRTGSRLLFGREGELAAEVVEKGGHLNRIRFDAPPEEIIPAIEKIGLVPLPPYIRRHPEKIDRLRYQTVYAEKKGAVAAPTAGLHFTEELLEEIRGQGTEIVCVTLHVGYASFMPVREKDVRHHRIGEEYFEIGGEATEVLNRTRKLGKRIVVCGTTSCRALETAAVSKQEIKAQKNWTGLFIHPPYDFKFTDCLITNFHLPRTTLLMLAAAFAGRDLMLEAYEYAVKNKFRFYSYGDAMLII